MRDWMRAKGEFNTGKQGQTERNVLLKYSHSKPHCNLLPATIAHLGFFASVQVWPLHNPSQRCSVSVCKCILYLFLRVSAFEDVY